MTTITEKIRGECATQFATQSGDCNAFVKAVSARFFDSPLFQGNNMNADAIIAQMGGSAVWDDLAMDHSKAISDAKAGRFVIAGMTSTELGSSHGHLAIIVGDDGQAPGTVTVPLLRGQHRQSSCASAAQAGGRNISGRSCAEQQDQLFCARHAAKLTKIEHSPKCCNSRSEATR